MTFWKCEVCFEELVNRETDDRCGFCGRKRGTYLCQRCGKINRPQDAACRYCGGKHDPPPKE